MSDDAVYGVTVTCATASNSKFVLAGIWAGIGFARHGFEGIEHEVEESVPGLERGIFNECAQMLEEGASRGQLGAYGGKSCRPPYAARKELPFAYVVRHNETCVIT